MSRYLEAPYNIRLWVSQGFTHFRYTPILGFAALLGLIRLGVYAHLLNVDEFGLLSKLLLISSFFCVGGSFGFQLLAARDVPAMFAVGRYRKGVIILGKAGIVTSATALALCLIPLLGVSLLGLSAMAFMFSVLHGWGQQIFMFVVIDSRSRLEMMRYSNQILVRTVSSFSGVVIVAVIGGGAISIVVVELVITVLLTTRMINHLLHTTLLSVPVFVRLSKKGFNKEEWHVATVLFAGAILSFLSISADRWLAADRLSGEEFGLYSFAWISLVAALSIQALLNAGLFPLIARRQAVGSNAKAFRITAIVSGGLLIVGLITAFTANALATWAIPRWYPQYINALPLLPPLLLAAAFRVSDFWSSYLIVIHWHNILLKTQFLLVLIPFLYYWWLRSEESSWMQVPYNFSVIALYLAIGSYILNAIAAFTSIKGVTT